MEDTMTNPQGNADTETATGTPETNNTSTVSEDVNSQKTGRTAQDRIRELAAKVRELEAMSKPAEKTSPDEDWKKKVELEISVPSYLKDKIDDMTAYWSKNPGMTKTDVFKVFTPVDTLVAEAKRAEEQAELSQSGGSSNPSAPDKDLSSMSPAELRAELEARIRRGEKV